MTNEYTYRMDCITEDIAKDIRDELTNRIREAVNSNQDCYIAHWVKQNPDKNLADYILVHGSKGEYYTFWLEHKSTRFGKYGRFEE